MADEEALADRRDKRVRIRRHPMRTRSSRARTEAESPERGAPNGGAPNGGAPSILILSARSDGSAARDGASLRSDARRRRIPRGYAARRRVLLGSGAPHSSRSSHRARRRGPRRAPFSTGRGRARRAARGYRARRGISAWVVLCFVFPGMGPQWWAMGRAAAVGRARVPRRHRGGGRVLHCNRGLVDPRGAHGRREGELRASAARSSRSPPTSPCRSASRASGGRGASSRP